MNTSSEALGPSRALFSSSIGAKGVMAVSGAVMAGWLTLHMLGNLLVLAGPAVMNWYGEHLHASGVLWPVRLFVSAALVAHVLAAIATTRRAWAARPIRYRHGPKHVRSTLASRSMRLTGALLALFLVYHVASVYGVQHPSYVTGDFHHNLSALLLSPSHASLLVLATGLIALHLAHGLTSACITVGWARAIGPTRIRRALQLWAAALTLGFALPPLALNLGWG